MTCPFCAPEATRVLAEEDLVVALWDAFPVTPGHALIVPRRHLADWFDATDDEHAAMARMTRRVRDAIVSRYGADGFTIGVNAGAAAGQTVPHLHLHVIPRRRGDVPDPRGGVRWVIPSRADYWSGGGG